MIKQINIKLLFFLILLPNIVNSQVYELTFSYDASFGEFKTKGTLEIIDDTKIHIKEVFRKQSINQSFDVELFFNENGVKKYTTPDKGDVSIRLTFMKIDMGKKRQYSLMIDRVDNFNKNKITSIYYMIKKE